MKNKILDKYSKITISTILLGFILIFIAFLTSSWELKKFQPIKISKISPNKIYTLDKQTKSFIFNLMEYEETCLHFVSDLKKIQVFQDNKLIYKIGEGTTFLGKTPGKIFHFIDIPTKTDKITVICQTTKDRNISNFTPTFWIGDSQAIYKEKIIQSLPYIIIYFITFLVGIIIGFYWLIIRKELNNNKEGLYFALLFIVIGLWLIRGSDFINILFKNHRAISFMGYILFLQIPFLLFLFALHYWHITYKTWIINTYCIVSSLNILICLILHTAKIIEFRELLFVAHILLIISLITMFYGMYIYWKKYSWNYKVLFSSIPLIFLLISTIIDYLVFYNNTVSSYKKGGIGILFFVISISISVVYDLGLQLKEARKNAMYQKLAITDLLTGLANRNAFEIWEKKINKNFFNSNISIVLCDLNNLKYYNDNYGHEIGDKYIIDASKILLKVFKDKGTCYRIGGDEFIIVLENISSHIIEKCFDELYRIQKEYNIYSPSLIVEIAYGYATIEKSDTSVIDIMNRADKLMYKYKKQLKEKKNN